ncbi:MAG: DMT family transporter [Thaumarchaeota archaeon]|nr:DMT family transporter [Nitrososphaerota archaeon]
MHQKTIGVLAVLGAALIWTLEVVLARFAFTTTTPLQTIALRSFFVMLPALGYALLKVKKTTLPPKELGVVIIIGLLGSVFADGLYYLALEKVPVLNAVFIAHLQPIFILLLGFFFLQDALTKYDYIGIFLMIIAGIMVTTKSLANAASMQFGTLGDLLILIGTLGWGITAILARKYLTRSQAGVVVFYRYLTASVVLFAILVLKDQFVFPSFIHVILGVLVGIGYILYYEGIKRLKAAQVSSVELASPFFGVLLGFAIFGELILPLQIAGMVLLGVGFHFIARREV